MTDKLLTAAKLAASALREATPVKAKDAYTQAVAIIALEEAIAEAERAQPEQYKELSERIKVASNGRVHMNPVTGHLGIGTQEQEQAAQDAVIGGVGVMLGDKRIDPKDMYAAPKQDSEPVDIDALCARIEAADDAAADNDYMLDSDDCISVIRGTWTGNFVNDHPKRTATPQPAPAVQPEPLFTKAMVDRFLTWPLPESVSPHVDPLNPHRSGTDLLTATEAEAMLRHVLGDDGIAEHSSINLRDDVPDAIHDKSRPRCVCCGGVVMQEQGGGVCVSPAIMKTI